MPRPPTHTSRAGQPVGRANWPARRRPRASQQVQGPRPPPPLWSSHALGHHRHPRPVISPGPGSRQPGAPESAGTAQAGHPCASCPDAVSSRGIRRNGSSSVSPRAPPPARPPCFLAWPLWRVVRPLLPGAVSAASPLFDGSHLLSPGLAAPESRQSLRFKTPSAGQPGSPHALHSAAHGGGHELHAAIEPLKHQAKTETAGPGKWPVSKTTKKNKK